MLVTISATPVGTPIVVDVAGNGKALLPVTRAEIVEGKLVISCLNPAAAKTELAAKPTAAAPSGKQMIGRAKRDKAEPVADSGEKIDFA
jgi:hypothetical protein